jgi:hypothetical protein
VTGDLWYDSANAQLKVWSGSAWITVGPSYTTTSGTSGAVVETILGSGSEPHVVVKFYISNTVVAILSKDSSFNPGTSISGFTSIAPGFNLSSTVPSAIFTGTVSTAATLQGVAASQFLRSDQASSTGYTLTAAQLNINGTDATVSSSSGDIDVKATTSGKDLNLWVNKTGVGSTKILGIVGATGAVTASGALSVTGATTLTGAVTMSSTTALNGVTTISAQVLPNANNTIEIGANATKFANVWATTFRGTAITASYADLAERFESDSAYAPGTVVALGGAKEITAAVEELSEDVFGVISTAAGFLMNDGAGSDSTHPAVAVNGRVPVRVIGKIRKGDRLVSAGRGLARSATRNEITAFNVLGRALEDKTTLEDGVIEAIVKLNS